MRKGALCAAEFAAVILAHVLEQVSGVVYTVHRPFEMVQVLSVLPRLWSDLVVRRRPEAPVAARAVLAV